MATSGAVTQESRQSSHTPGPWKVAYGKHYPRAIVREHGTDVPGGINSIVRWNGIGFPSSNEAQANARLIAAAPELLEALRYLIAECDQDMDDDYNPHAAPLAKARAAIAKAEGK